MKVRVNIMLTNYKLSFLTHITMLYTYQQQTIMKTDHQMHLFLTAYLSQEINVRLRKITCVSF
jgi:hypothetical protein